LHCGEANQVKALL